MIVIFTSSSYFLDEEPHAEERAEVEVSHYLEGTYTDLRTGPNGDLIATLVGGAWQLPDGRRFSDWAIRLPDPQ